MASNIQNIKINSVQVGDKGRYVLFFSGPVLLWAVDSNTGNYEEKECLCVDFDSQDLIDQCCSLKEEIRYLYLKLDSFGSSELHILLRDSVAIIEQTKSSKVIKTMINKIEITSPRSIKRFSEIETEYLNIVKLTSQNKKGVELYESAEIYYYGTGVEKDIVKGIDLYIKSADMGNVKSKISLYDIYFRGEEVLEDSSKAINLLQDAADQGSDDAREMLAEHFFNGEGVKRDLDKALELYFHAAVQNNQSAQYQLGLIYQFGTGVTSNLKNAVKWYELSQKRDKYVEGQTQLGRCYEQGDEANGLKKDMGKAIKCYEFAAQYNNFDSLFSLGMCYEFGKGLEKDVNKAIDCYSRSIENGGDAFVWGQLGSIYFKLKDYDKAIYFLKGGAEDGAPHFQLELANCYYHGLGDKLSAVDWFLKAAKNGDSMAAHCLEFLDFK